MFWKLIVWTFGSTLVLIGLGVVYFIVSTIREIMYFRKKKVHRFPTDLTSTFKFFTGKMSLVEILQLSYTRMKTRDVPISGAHQFGKPVYMVKDMEILKHIFIKDFDHFVNRSTQKFPENDVIVQKMLLFVNDAKWRYIRSKMSPTFTTGKIKRMFPLFSESSKRLVKYVGDLAQSNEDGEVNLENAFGKFTMDTIASAVCAIDSKAFDTTTPSQFETMAGKILTQDIKTIFRSIFLLLFPNASSRLNLTVFDHEGQSFFSHAVKSSINYQRGESDKVKREDFIHLMLEEAKEGSSNLDPPQTNPTEESFTSAEVIDDEFIISNAILFILAGFDTTQTLLTFCTYSLALHQDVQDKLRGEVGTWLDENGGEFTYEGVNSMPYLGMVINESLRLYPPAVAISRVCTKTYNIPGTDIVIEKGDTVAANVIGIHRDEKYYPDPEKFMPERFSSENKDNLNQYAFLGFGHGSRNCIGMRFALTEARLAIAQLVHNFRIEPSKNTLIPMQYTFGKLKPKGGMFLSLRSLKD